MLTSHVTGNVTCWQVTFWVSWLCVTKLTKCDQIWQIWQMWQLWPNRPKWPNWPNRPKWPRNTYRVFETIFDAHLQNTWVSFDRSFHMKKISTVVDNNQPPARFCDMKRDLPKETYKKLRIGQYTWLSPIACPILFLKTLLYFMICLFL